MKNRNTIHHHCLAFVCATILTAVLTGCSGEQQSKEVHDCHHKCTHNHLSQSSQANPQPHEVKTFARKKRICAGCNNHGTRKCYTCNGTGYYRFNKTIRCDECSGRGWKPCTAESCPLKQSSHGSAQPDWVNLFCNGDGYSASYHEPFYSGYDSDFDWIKTHCNEDGYSDSEFDWIKTHCNDD